MRTQSPGNEASAVPRPFSGTKKELQALKPDLSQYRLPALKPTLSAKQIRLAYTTNNVDYTNPFDFDNQIVKVEKVHESLMQLKAVPTLKPQRRVKSTANLQTIKPIGEIPPGTQPVPLIKKPRRRGPKTGFKISKNRANTEKLESVLVGYIEQNKFLKSATEEIVLHPQNRIQASLNTLKQVNKILPHKVLRNIMKHFGYDDDNLDRNHLVLEKIMCQLERIFKNKKRREERELFNSKPTESLQNQ